MSYLFLAVYNFLSFLRQGCGGTGGGRSFFLPDSSFLVGGHAFTPYCGVGNVAPHLMGEFGRGKGIFVSPSCSQAALVLLSSSGH